MLSALFIKEAAAAFPAASSCQTHLAFQTPQRSCSSLPLNLLYRGFAQAVPLPVDFSRLNFILHYVNQLECHHLHNFPSLSPCVLAELCTSCSSRTLCRLLFYSAWPWLCVSSPVIPGFFKSEGQVLESLHPFPPCLT